EDIEYCKKYLNLSSDEEGYTWEFIRAAWASVADTAIAPMQDFLNLDSKARMNIPSTLGGNWQWRVLPSDINKDLSGKIKDLTVLYGRNP
ncbi:MAG: 4-alpha-glucanotransferase, partial [Oscillospiraceae bacterium]